MATFVHIAGLRGINVDCVTHWDFQEKRGSTSKEEQGRELPRLRLFFGMDAYLDLDGDDAKAMHRYFCGAGSLSLL